MPQAKGKGGGIGQWTGGRGVGEDAGMRGKGTGDKNDNNTKVRATESPWFLVRAKPGGE
jgi:hypothetical protein